MENTKRMTHSELKALILDTIRSLYNKEYIGKLDIRDLEPQGYVVSFEPHQYKPVIISAELPDDLFLKFLKNELRAKRFLDAEYFKCVRNTTGPGRYPFFVYDSKRANRENRHLDH